MTCEVESKHIQEINSTNTLQQTAFWARVKNRQGMDPYAFRLNATRDLVSPHANENEKLHDDILVLVRYINEDYCYAYIPYGPKVQPEHENYGLFLEELSEVIRPQLPDNCILIRYDLPWENPWSVEEDYYDNEGNWTGPPSINSQEFRLNFNTHNWNLMKSPSDNLPTSTFYLDLDRKENDLLMRMKPKTRYNIRLSYRRGVRVHEYGTGNLDEWYELYKETALRNHINLHKKEHFQSVLRGHDNIKGKVRTSLLMAEREGEYLAAMFLVLSKNRGTYLYGASSSHNRNLMATYSLQWEAIKKSREYGCREYDMFGCAPNPDPSHPLYGLYRFKSGFGGDLYHRMGCWDYPLNNDEYPAFIAREMNSEGYHLN